MVINQIFAIVFSMVFLIMPAGVAHSAETSSVQVRFDPVKQPTATFNVTGPTQFHFVLEGGQLMKQMGYRSSLPEMFRSQKTLEYLPDMRGFTFKVTNLTTMGEEKVTITIETKAGAKSVVTFTIKGSGLLLANVLENKRAEAESRIRSAGITNIRFTEAPVQNPLYVGRVIKQDPPGDRYIQKGDTVTLTIGTGNVVPDMLLKTEAEAVAAVKAAGLVPVVSYYNESSAGAVGKVTKSDPMPHRIAPPDRKVTLMVGRSSFDMPNVTGIPLTHATANLDLISKAKSLNLKYTVNTKDTKNINDDGKVFDQNPKAGTVLSPGMVITLSAYRWIYEMPNFTGMTDREAFAALNQINSARPGFIKMTATQTKDITVQKDNDRIHDQSPKPGTIVQPGSTAMFYTYHYKQPSQQLPAAPAFVVPNVVGMTEKDAVLAMAKAVIKLSPTKYIVSDKQNQGRVISQSIPAGTKTSGAVTLTVGKN